MFLFQSDMQSIVPTTIHNLSFLLEQEQVIHTKKICAYLHNLSLLFEQEQVIHKKYEISQVDPFLQHR